jgi:DNA (cytosine-5)-methyltransferase 1
MLTAIDLFAGLGGFTVAAQSVGINVIFAANHWKAAVQYHSANHPGTAHSCQDLHQADWEQVPAHDILLASPCCQGHSKARGKDRPHSDKSRATAWAVVSCAEFHKPAGIVVENVTEFLNWTLYPSWKMALEALGYALSVNVFDAADAGVPQNRERVFIVGTRSKSPLTINPPAALHSPASKIIDWSAGNWSDVIQPDRAAATIVRARHGWETIGERFCFSYYGNTKTARPLSRPIGTITTRDRWAVVDGKRMRMLRVREACRAMGFPEHYYLPRNTKTAMHLLGNAVPPPLAAHVLSEIRRAA